MEDENTSEGNRKGNAVVMCHELAHQWFGNIVTTVSSFFNYDRIFTN